MKDFISQIFNKIKASGVSRVDITYLKDNSWFHVNEDVLKSKTVFIFKNGGQLLISKDGDITKASWENLIHSTNSLIIEINDKPILYNIIYLTTEYLVIQKDGTEIVEVFIKQNRYDTKLPKDPDNNPINIIYDDLKSLLNQRNVDRIENIRGEKQIPSKRTIAPHNHISSTYLMKLAKDEVNYTVNASQPDDTSVKVFDKNIILQHIKNQYHITQEDEIDFFVFMEEIEEELIEKGMLCPTCKSLYTIDSETCFVCQEHNFCSNCQLSYDVCICYGEQRVSADDKRLMQKYSITYKDEKYHFQQHQYVNFRDAINYAMLCEEKAAEDMAQKMKS